MEDWQFGEDLKEPPLLGVEQLLVILELLEKRKSMHQDAPFWVISTTETV